MAPKQAPVPRLVLGQLPPVSKIESLPRDHDQVAGSAGPELIQQLDGGVWVRMIERL
jgi:hypothetical protein